MASRDLYSKVDRVFNIGMSPVMMLLSVLGNSLAFLVLSRRSFSAMPMSVYLRFLAVMDVGTVVTGLLPRFILALTDYDVRGTNTLSCQCQVYIVYVFTELSAWTLVIVTSERVLSIVKPHKVKILCTKFKSFGIIAAVVAVILLANIPIFIFFGKQIIYKQNDNSQISEMNYNVLNSSSTMSGNMTSVLTRLCGFINGEADVWFLTHFVKQSLLPFVLIFALNIAIIIALLRRRATILKIYVDHFSSHHSHRTQTKRSAEGHSMTRRDASLSVSLVTINAVFLICNFPIGIYQQIFYNFPDREVDPQQSLIYSFLVFILYLNNTLNFILYSLTGSRFRKELHEMLVCT